MPPAAQLSSGASRIPVLALLVLPLMLPAAVFAERTRASEWQLVPTPSSQVVQITSDPVLGLYPGVSKKLILKLRNTARRHGVLVRRVGVRDVATTRVGCAASPRNLLIRQYRGAAFRIPPGGTRRVTVLLSMPNTVSNACQRAGFKLRYTAQAWIARGS